MEDFAQKLKHFRSTDNLSQTQFAQKVGISQKQVSDYEIGLSKPRLSTFKKILEVFNLTEDEFWSGERLITEKNMQHPLLSLLTSSLRGEFIGITGFNEYPPCQDAISVHLYTGVITHTQDINDYVAVFYLTFNGEQCIYVHQDVIKPILQRIIQVQCCRLQMPN